MILVVAVGDVAGKAAATAPADNEPQPPISETAEEQASTESGQPQEASADTSNVEPMASTEATDAASSDDAAEVASSAAAMNTDATSTAAAASTKDYPSELPFQVQITYTDLDGAEAVRVLTQTQPVTRDRQQAETGMSHLSMFHFYHAMLCIRCTSHGPVSVHHKSEFY